MRYYLRSGSFLLTIFLFFAAKSFAAHNLEQLKNLICEGINYEFGSSSGQIIKEQTDALLSKPVVVKSAIKNHALFGATILPSLGASYFINRSASNLGEHIANNLLATGAAVALLPSIIITAIPGATLGGTHGAVESSIQKVKVKWRKQSAKELAWHYFRFINDLIIQSEQKFIELPLENRIDQLSSLIVTLKNETEKSRGRGFKVSALIKYESSQEGELRGAAMDLILSTTAFNKPNKAPAFTVDELRAFAHNFEHPHLPTFITQEAAYLTIRFASRFMDEHEALRGVHISDIIRALLDDDQM